jgi:DNA-binding transcriptional ArsR family regulator
MQEMATVLSKLACDPRSTLPIVRLRHFVYHRNVSIDTADVPAYRIAAAIGDPARSRMLYCLMDGHARTSTELAVAAGVSPSTASAHLNRLKEDRLVQMAVQGKHRYYCLHGAEVAMALEALCVLAADPPPKFVPNTPDRLRGARTCYDHMAGRVAVALHDRLRALNWICTGAAGGDVYEVTPEGARALAALGIDVEATRALRRKFCFACLDWSERRPHIGGGLGSALLGVALKRKWVVRDLDSRALSITAYGRREMQARFGMMD